MTLHGSNWLVLVVVIGAWSCTGLAVAGTDQTERDTAPLYLIHDQGGWGLVDSDGRVVLEPRFEQVAGRPTRLDATGAARAQLVLDEIQRAEPVTDRLIPVRLAGKAGFAGRDGRVIELGSYDSIDARASGDRFRVSADGRVGFADTAGVLVVPLDYDDARPFQFGYAFVERDGKWGIIDPAGKPVVAPTWDEVAEVYDWSAHYEWRAVRIGAQWGVVDRAGREIVPPRFEAIANPTPPLVAARLQGRHVYVRPGGDIAFDVPCPATRKGPDPDARGYPFFGARTAKFSCDQGNKWGLVDANGRVALAPEWDVIGQFDAGHAVAARQSRNALIDALGTIRVPLGKYELHGPYGELVAFREPNRDGLLRGLVAPTEAGRYGFMDVHERIVVPPTLDWFGGCDDGLCLVCRQGKVGFVDVTGKWVIEPQLQFAGLFRGPLAVTTRDIGNGVELRYIDRTGKPVYTMRIAGVRIRGQCGLMQVYVDRSAP